MNVLYVAFRTVFSISIAGSLVFFLLFLLKLVAQRVFSQTWRYRMCILAATFFLLPVGMVGNSLYTSLPHQNAQSDRPLAVSTLLNTVAPLPITDDIMIDSPVQVFIPPPEMKRDTGIFLSDVLPFLPYIWLIGVGLSTSMNGFRYFRFKRRLFRSNLPIENKGIYSLLEDMKTTLGVSGKIRLLTNDTIKTPMLTGIFSTLLILPEVEANERELSTVFRHELIHYQRRDLWIKTIVLFIEAIHWFNPLVYFLSREIETSCELSCDEQVVHDMSAEDRHFYGETILNMLGRVAGKHADICATLAKTKKGIERRLILMLRFKKMSKKMAAFSIVVAMLFTLAGCIGAASISVAAGSTPSTIQDPALNLVSPAQSDTSDTSDLNRPEPLPYAGVNASNDKPSLPRVDSFDNEDISKGARNTIEAFWGIDLSNMVVLTDVDAETEVNRDEILVSFLSEPEGLIYSASIDKETKSIVALDSLSKKSDSSASNSLLKEYISAASTLISDKFGIQASGEGDCYLPLVAGKAVTDRTVYVFFPDWALHVELSLTDYHPVGYRFFSDAESMKVFIQLHAESL